MQRYTPMLLLLGGCVPATTVDLPDLEVPPSEVLIAALPTRVEPTFPAPAFGHQEADVGEPDRSFLTSSPHPECLDPAPATGAFRDGMPGSGIAFRHQDFPPPADGRIDDPLLATLHLSSILGGGAAVADFDGDGPPDIFFAQGVGPNEFVRGRGDGTFEPAAAGEATLGQELAAGASAADIDADGDPDLAVFGLNLLRLFRNDGGEFVDITDAMGLEAARGWTAGVAWADVDLDGDLDLLAAGYAETILGRSMPLVTTETRLWRNDHGAFSDISSGLPDAAVDGAALLATFRDVDQDGDPDLLLTHDFGDWGENTVLLENRGVVGGEVRWVDRFAASGTGILRAPMGAAFRDLDRDGILDLWFSDLGGTRPLRGLGPFSFVDSALTWDRGPDATHEDTSWSVVALDLGGRGRSGLFFAYGSLPAGFQNGVGGPDQSDRWLRPRATDRGGEVEFEHDPSALPPGPAGASRGAAMGDFDRNGVPDLVVGRIGEAPGLLLGRCNDAHRLVVELRDERRADARGVGAVVSVTAGGTTQRVTMDAGGLGTYSGSEPVLFFGLGSRNEVDELAVQWPDGAVDHFDDVCAHCRVRVTRD